MKRTVIECDICGDDIGWTDGVLEIKAVWHFVAGGGFGRGYEHSKRRTRVHICPYCREKIRSLVLADEKPTGNVADVMKTGGNDNAE